LYFASEPLRQEGDTTLVTLPASGIPESLSQLTLCFSWNLPGGMTVFEGCASHFRKPLTFDSHFQMELSRRTEHNLSICQPESEKPIRSK
jgi:hypothetical protein